MKYSYSRLSLYEDCPRFFKFKYIDKIQKHQGVSKPAERGSYLHSILEYHFNKDAKLYNPRGFSLADKEEAHATISLFLKSSIYQFIKKTSESSLEIQTEFDISSISETLLGFIDLFLRLNNTALIVDYKSGKQREFDENQNKLYASALFEKYSEIDLIYSFYVSLDRREYTYFRYKRENFTFEWLDTLSDKINKDDEFLPVFGHRCSYCPYLVECQKLQTSALTKLINI